jgi:hypothetical protein
MMRRRFLLHRVLEMKVLRLRRQFPRRNTPTLPPRLPGRKLQSSHHEWLPVRKRFVVAGTGDGRSLRS